MDLSEVFISLNISKLRLQFHQSQTKLEAKYNHLHSNNSIDIKQEQNQAGHVR